MALKFTPKFSIAGVIADVNNRIKRTEAVLIEQFQIVGEQFVADARNNGDYTDRTGNLRSSIGYIIYKDGEPLDENFRESDNGTDRKTGTERGQQVAENLSKDIPQKGFALVVVAGMNYALYVEVYYGYNVITYSSWDAEKELKHSIELIKKNL